MTTCNDIYGLAWTAQRRARRILSGHDLSHLVEDMVQEAALSIVIEQRRRPGRAAGYYVAAAANDVVQWITRSWWRGPRRTSRIIDRTDSVSAPQPEPEQEIDLHAVAASGRRHGGERAAAAIRRDAAILERRMAGWSEAAIAADLGLTKSAVHMALTRMRERMKEQGS